MLFSNEFINALKSSPLNGCIQVVRLVTEQVTQHAHGWQDKDHEILTEAYAVVSVVLDAGLIKVDIEEPVLRGKLKEDCTAINQFLTRLGRECIQLKSSQRIETLKASVRQTLGIVPAVTGPLPYEPGVKELQRMGELLTQMATALSAFSALSEEHRARLVKRVERVRSELSSSMADFDRFWGLLGDARVMIVKIGDQARPLVSRLSELSELAWGIQARGEGISAGSTLPQLELLRLGRD